MSSNDIDLTVDSNFNITIEISIIFKLPLHAKFQIPAFLCFHHLQKDDVIKSDNFVGCFFFQLQ